MAHSNAIIGTFPIDMNTSKDLLELLRSKYYRDKSNELRAGSVLFMNGLVNKNGQFFDPYLKKITTGPLVTPEGMYIPEKFRKQYAKYIHVNLNNKSQKDIDKWTQFTTENPIWQSGTPQQPPTQQPLPTTTQQSLPTPQTITTPQSLPILNPPVTSSQQMQVGNTQVTNSIIFATRPSPNILSPIFTPTTATGTIPKVTNPIFNIPNAPTPTPTNLPRLQIFDTLDDILNTIRDVKYKKYDNIKSLEYDTSGDKAREIYNFYEEMTKSDIQKIYQKVFNQKYNPNLDITSLVMRMYPEDDISHGVCFRPVYNDADKKFEYACDKFVYLFAFFAKKSIKISTFQFTQDALLYALASAKMYNNVDVEMIVNPGQISRYTTFSKAQECGIKIYVNCVVKNPVLHHDKFLIFDDKVLITGSYNLSQNANKNFENYVVISNSPVIESYKKRFDAIKSIGSPYDPPKHGDYATGCAN